MFDSGSQVNLIFEEIVKKLNLETTTHTKPYPLGWLCDDNLQVARKRKLKFAIIANFIDEVELDGASLDICGIILGIPYLYEQNSIFHLHENKYHLFKYGFEYKVIAHCKKHEIITY